MYLTHGRKRSEQADKGHGFVGHLEEAQIWKVARMGGD